MLIQRDVERKRQALEEEKNLINERLQARKDAEQEAEKYEQLAENQRPLAYVSMDSTRTKDAAELRKKISDLQNELAWGQAEKEAQAQQEILDEQLAAYERFGTTGDEQLDAYLKDANHFVSTVNELLQGSKEDLIDWLKANVDEYKLSLDEQQQNMIEGWTDTFKQMYNITEHYFELIELVIGGGIDSFLDYMKMSDEYQKATADMQSQLEYQWREMYEDYIAALKTGAEYEHLDDLIEALGKAANKSSGGGGGSGNGSGSGSNATEAAEEGSSGSGWSLAKIFNGIAAAGTTLWNPIRSMLGYDSGGLVTFTGPAMVHGSPTNPEAFLSAEDTALMRGFLDAAKYVSVKMSMPFIDDSLWGGSATTIGDVNITINEATISSDQDIDILAERVGDSFVKQLSAQGFHTSNYSF